MEDDQFAWDALFSRPSLETVHGVPHFVEVSDDYCQNFGKQWNQFRELQIDSLSGSTHSHDRFFSETGWKPADLRGKLLLDVGCGAGRFAEVALECGARLVAVDLSTAVFACRETLSPFPADQYRVIRASLFDLPLQPETFDGVYSLGVLQHTPDPLGAIRAIARFVKPGGQLATWIYKATDQHNLMGNLTPKMLFRRFLVNDWSPDAILRFSKVMVAAGFPLGWVLSWFGRPGELLSYGLPYAARHHLARGSWRRQWLYCLMDTMDWYGPSHDSPQTEAAVMEAMRSVGLEPVSLDVKGAVVGMRPTY